MDNSDNKDRSADLLSLKQWAWIVIIFLWVVVIFAQAFTSGSVGAFFETLFYGLIVLPILVAIPLFVLKGIGGGLQAGADYADKRKKE